MASPAVVQVHPLSEVRARLSGILARFRREGAAAEPVAFGSHRKPEAILISYEAYERYEALARQRGRLDDALSNKLGLSTTEELATAEREITHAALIFLKEAPVLPSYNLMHLERLTYYLGEVNAIHPFREGNGRAQRAFFAQLAGDAGFTLDWQHLDADRNIAASAAIMRGDPTLMRPPMTTSRPET